MSKKIEFNKSLVGMSSDDLKSRIREDEMRLKKLTFAHAITPLENPMTIRDVRRDLARMKSELKKRELVA
jgi:large subunit ribosomal protein L29